ncbi:ATP-dependent nuclease [Flavobacterium gawalongense]|uniref:AAA family ATPase n=1 Tax=Flavobacterium gawalongense TaxID=2594432 RepID=A0ABY3CPU7_9FLAO|nr:AAA family ATPase [Flavobacterium gawalongense]TRX03218.1 AAA family ATPase [Flavobacterium gawalongense]TRX09880.1 AAA family ATPase [Flavobacterium gawalongense]
MATIKKIRIENFKCFDKFELSLNKGINIIVGNNEAGKSTILEAIHVCLTGILNGRYLKNELSQYLFNKVVEKQYLDSLKTHNKLLPPKIEIELFLEGDGLENLMGDGNSEHNSNVSLLFKIEFDDSFQPEYDELIRDKKLSSIPIEYYKIEWRTSARENVTSRSIPIKSALIDSSSTKFQNGSDVYISRIIRDDLEEKEKVAISQAYREMRDGFIGRDTIKAINEKIENKSKISKKKIHICVDLSTKNAWETTLMTYIDDIPFHYIGKGEQCIIKTKLALGHSKASESNVILLEEPENHLSHTKLNEFVGSLIDEIAEKQIIISTHSSFIANKLGLNNLILINDKKSLKFNDLLEGTQDFFKKLPGYNTLRLILCEKALLVEGPSDELIVQRAFMDENSRKLPIENGIDVISVGLTFKRFLEIASKIDKKVAVVTDNDGDFDSKISKKYEDYTGLTKIKICADNRNVLHTLEPQVVDANKDNLEEFSKIVCVDFQKYNTEETIGNYLKDNKTEWALNVFESKEKIGYPKYIKEAITWINE